MAQEFLHRTDVGAVVEHVSRTRVAQYMRGQTVAETDLVSVKTDDSPCPLTTQPAATLIEKDGIRVVTASPTLRLHGAASAGGHPLVQCDRRVSADRDDALLAPLAQHPGETIVQVDVTEREPDEFGDSHASAVKRLENRPIPASNRTIAHDHLDERRDLVERERLRKPPRNTRHLELCGRIVDAELLDDQKPVQSPYRDKRAGDRRGREPFADEHVDESDHVVGSGSDHSGTPPGKMIAVTQEVSPVGLERVGRTTFLDRKPDQKVLGLGFECDGRLGDPAVGHCHRPR